MQTEFWTLREDKIWCMECHELRDVDQATYTMNTCYRLHPDGMYRFGVCVEHDLDEN